jgi:hypothetical protein
MTGRLVRVATPLPQQEIWARLVFGISVAAFAVGEFSHVVKWRRSASRTDVRGEVVFRVIFFAGILMLPLAQALAPQAVPSGAGVFVLGTVIAWLGLLLPWWSFATSARGARDDRQSGRRPSGLRQGPCASCPLRLVTGGSEGPATPDCVNQTTPQEYGEVHAPGGAERTQRFVRSKCPFTGRCGCQPK